MKLFPGTDDLAMHRQRHFHIEPVIIIEPVFSIEPVRPCWLAPRLQPFCDCSTGSAQPPRQPTSVRLHKRPGLRDGRHCSQSQPSGHRAPCWCSHFHEKSMAMKLCLICRSCWPTPVGNSPSWPVASQPAVVGACQRLPVRRARLSLRLDYCAKLRGQKRIR